MNCWDILGIEPTRDLLAIKRAYAKQLKTTRPDDDAQGYQQLREAYDEALARARYDYDEDDGDEPEDEPAVEISAETSAENSEAVTPDETQPWAHVRVLDAEALLAATAAADEVEGEPQDALPSQADEAADSIPDVEALVEHCEDLLAQPEGAEALLAYLPVLLYQLNRLPLGGHWLGGASWHLAQFVLGHDPLPPRFVNEMDRFFNWSADFRQTRMLGDEAVNALRERLNAARLADMAWTQQHGAYGGPSADEARWQQSAAGQLSARLAGGAKSVWRSLLAMLQVLLQWPALRLDLQTVPPRLNGIDSATHPGLRALRLWMTRGERVAIVLLGAMAAGMIALVDDKKPELAADPSILVIWSVAGCIYVLLIRYALRAVEGWLLRWTAYWPRPWLKADLGDWSYLAAVAALLVAVVGVLFKRNLEIAEIPVAFLLPLSFLLMRLTAAEMLGLLLLWLMLITRADAASEWSPLQRLIALALMQGWFYGCYYLWAHKRPLLLLLLERPVQFFRPKAWWGAILAVVLIKGYVIMILVTLMLALPARVMQVAGRFGVLYLTVTLAAAIVASVLAPAWAWAAIAACLYVLPWLQNLLAKIPVQRLWK